MNLQTRIVQSAATNNEEDEGMHNLKVQDLKDICRMHDLHASGTKTVLISRIHTHVEALPSNVFDADEEAEEFQIDST